MGDWLCAIITCATFAAAAAELSPPVCRPQELAESRGQAIILQAARAAAAERFIKEFCVDEKNIASEYDPLRFEGQQGSPGPENQCDPPGPEDQYDPLRLENQLCFPLYVCAKEIIRKYRRPLSELGLTYTQYIVMMALWEYGCMTEGELGEKVHLDSGTLAPLLKRLESLGYVSRVRLKCCERKLMISLTEEGRQLREKALKVPEAMAECVPLAGEDVLRLKELLDKMLGIIGV